MPDAELLNHLRGASESLDRALQRINKATTTDFEEGYEQGWIEAALVLLSMASKRMGTQ